MKWSAALLVKLNAAQLNYHVRNYGKKRSTWVPTDSQVAGTKFADSQVLGPYVEMVSSVTYRDHEIFYSFDEIFKPGPVTYLIERKQPPTDPDKHEAYFLKAVAQISFYEALFSIPGRNEFQTANFAVKKGATREFLAIEHDAPKVKSVLQFGADSAYYEILGVDKRRLLRYYMTKLRASLDYNKAREFDAALGNKLEEQLGDWNYKTCRQLQLAAKSRHTSTG